jgi:hypothetical protein
MLAVAPRLVELAERLLGRADLRIYSAEACAPYTGATNYDQDLHRGYLNRRREHPDVPLPVGRPAYRWRS